MRMELVFAGLRACCLVVLMAAALSTGCGGSGSSRSMPQGLPVAPQASQTNSYFGTQSPGDVWKVTIDHTGNSFSAADLTANTGTSAGLFTMAAGFLDFSQTNIPPAFQPFGFGLEVLGRAALLRPGDNTNPLVPLVQQNSCMNVDGAVTFQFVSLPNSLWAKGTDMAYGLVQASTSGNTWNFSHLTQFTLASSPNNPGAALSTGICGQSAAGLVISVPPSPTISNTLAIAVGPSGFFLADQGPGNPGEFGVVQPTSPLNTSSVVNALYLGFIDEPGATAVGLPVSEMASFGCSGAGCPTPPTNTSMIGGTFASDDPTQPANTDATIDLGTQDSANNGLYKSAAVTIPDLADACHTGTGTCTFPAVAVVGNPENKFAVFLIAQDMVNNLPMTIYLFQQ